MARRISRAEEALVNGLFDLYPDEAARLVEGLGPGEAARLLGGASAARSGRIFERLTPDFAADLLERVDAQGAFELIMALEPGRAAALLARLEDRLRQDLLHRAGPASGRELRALMTYGPDTAGRLMEARVMTFRPDTTVKESLARLRSRGNPRIHDVFLVDPGGHLVGAVTVQSLALAAPSERLVQHARRAPVSVQATSSREEVVELLDQHRLISLPVVDYEGRIMGVIRYDALVAAAREEASADIQTMVGASPEERALSRIPFAVRKRLPWLQVNLATAFLAAAVVGMFEGLIARFTALAVLLPVVAGQSGNTGAQALAVTMRGLALREVRTRHWLRILVKEAGVGTANGVAVAATTSLAVYFWSGSAGLMLIIGISMVLSMIAAGSAGAIIPMVLTSLGQDPAQSSSIILTTVTDVVGFFSFLGVATLLSGLLG